MANLDPLRGQLPACVLLLALTTPSSAQAPAAEPEARPDLPALLDAWRARHGAAWRVLPDPQSGWMELLYGGAAAPERAPIADEEFAALARAAVVATQAMHGVDARDLGAPRVKFLPLAQIGTTDKVAVELEQRVAGVPVRRGSVNALFDTRGWLLALHVQGVPLAGRVALDPLVAPARARELAAQAFARDERAAATWIGEPALEIVRAPAGAALPGELAWRVEARSQADGALPAGRAYWIGARDGALLDSEATVHEFEVRGTVRALVTPGTNPDTASNPEVSVPMRYLRVTSAQGSVLTDANGAFSFPGVNSSLAVTVGFAGSFNNVQNVAGAEYALTQTLPANQDNTLTMNPSASAQVTAQGNAFHHVNLLRDFVRAIDPTDTHADFVMAANVNLNQTCNAYYDGGSTNFFLAGGSCVNTAYSSVVAHECGHWLNDRYGTGNGPDGMGEGNADVWSMYLYDDAIVGRDFCGTGCNVRSGLNTRAFCGDLTPSCYGEVHADGEPWMGAAWKVRARLNTALGNALGDLTANTLFLGWMNAFNQTQIRSIIETQWLLLDDDDGDLNNGSPRYAQIDGGFRDQGFPGVALHPVTIDQATSVADTPVEAGPYGVEARAVAHMPGRTIASVALTWRVNGGAWSQLPLVPQGGDLFGNSIPPVAAPAQVDYYLTATDSQGVSETWPSGAPAASSAFRVGAQAVFWSESFESGAAGWTHASYGDTANPADDWQLGPPGGAFGTAFAGATQIAWRDPSSAFAGTNCWGTDLGVGTNGTYTYNVHSRLRSPFVDCSGAIGVHLRFWRWLSVQAGQFDQARVRVNGNVVWSNPQSQNVLDLAWTLQDLDISDWADGNPAVQIEFELRTDGSVQLGGWNVDEVELTHLGPSSGGCSGASAYGPGKVNSTGLTAELRAYGEPSLLFNNLELGLVSGPPGRLAVVYSSGAPASTPMLGGTFLIASPFAREIAWQLTPFGDAATPYPVLPALVGTTRYYQAVFRDPGIPDGTGMGFSKALRIGFCP